MIDAISNKQTINKQNLKSKRKKSFVCTSGYAATACGAVCAASGLKQVKFKNKMTIHKISALLTGIFTALHIALIKFPINKLNSFKNQ